VTFQNACLAECSGATIAYNGACGSPRTGTARAARDIGGALDAHPIGSERHAAQG
jgi:hypothetical protein